MSIYTHTLTPIEEACGVTLEAVATELERGAFYGDVFAIRASAGPALAQSTARCAFSGADVEFSHLALGGMPCYRRAI